MTRNEAYRLLAGLEVGDPVIFSEGGKEHALTVQRALRRADGGFGSWDHAVVTIGYGPGRWNREVSAAAIDHGFAQLRRAS